MLSKISNRIPYSDLLAEVRVASMFSFISNMVKGCGQIWPIQCTSLLLEKIPYVDILEMLYIYHAH